MLVCFKSKEEAKKVLGSESISMCQGSVIHEISFLEYTPTEKDKLEAS